LGGIALAVIALALLAVHWALPDVQFDTPALVLLVLAATPMLSLFLRSVKLPGGIEVELADLRQRVDERAKESQDRDRDLARQQLAGQVRADRQVREAIVGSAATSAGPIVVTVPGGNPWAQASGPWETAVAEPLVEDLVPAARSRTVMEEDLPAAPYPGDPAGPAPAPPVIAGDGPPGLAAMADEYVEVRERMTYGTDRTRAMTVLVNRMIGIAASDSSWNPVSWLDDPHPGRRLAAYAWLYARPDVSLVNRLILALPMEDSAAFGQYWLLRAISAAVDERTSVSPAARDLLLRYAQTLSRGGDRSAELGFLLFQLGIEAP
jgi:hypothetical protein